MPLIKPHTNLTKNSIFSVENSLKIGYHHQRFSSLHPTYLHASKSTFQHSVIPCHTPSRPVMPCCAPSRPVAPRCALSRLVAPRRAPSRPVAPCCTLQCTVALRRAPQRPIAPRRAPLRPRLRKQNFAKVTYFFWNTLYIQNQVIFSILLHKNQLIVKLK